MIYSLLTVANPLSHVALGLFWSPSPDSSPGCQCVPGQRNWRSFPSSCGFCYGFSSFVVAVEAPLLPVGPHLDLHFWFTSPPSWLRIALLDRFFWLLSLFTLSWETTDPHSATPSLVPISCAPMGVAGPSHLRTFSEPPLVFTIGGPALLGTCGSPLISPVSQSIYRASFGPAATDPRWCMLYLIAWLPLICILMDEFGAVTRAGA